MKCAGCDQVIYSRDVRHRYCSKQCRLRQRNRSHGLIAVGGSGSIAVLPSGRVAFRICAEGVRKEETRYRVISGYALKGRLSSDLIVHHNDGICDNDMPSNLAVCESVELHRLLEAYTRVRLGGFHFVPERPIIPGVTWIADYLDDTENIYEEARAWWIDLIVDQINQELFVTM